MSTLWLLTTIVLCAGSASAQTGSLQGTVVLDKTSDPVHHASVLIVQLKRTAQSGDDGTFRFDNLPVGRYVLLAHMHALTSQRITVEVTAGGVAKAEFRLRLAAVKEEVTVTASGKEESTLETFLATTTVDSTDLAAQTATSLGDVLENQAGVAKRSFGPGTSRPVIRGFDGDRVLIMQDGVRTGTLSSQSGDHGEPIDPNSVDRVEIVRGPSTLLYEGSAIGGVVNMVTGHHQTHKEAHEGYRGFVTGIGGTNNNRRGLSGGLEYGHKSWLLSANGGGIYQDSYHARGLVPNSQSDIRNASLAIGHYGEKTYFNLSYGIQDGGYGIPFDRQEQDPEVVTIPFRRQNVAFTGGLKNIGNLFDQFQLSLNYSDWKHTEQDAGVPANFFFNKQFVYRGVFDQKQHGRFTGSFGFWGLARDYKVNGDEAIAPPTRQNAFAAFAVQGVSLGRVKLQYGARVEHNAYDPTGLDKTSFNGVAASGGANVGLWRGGVLVGSFSSSFRSPALEELYNNGPHPGNLTFEVGDARLKRERGNGVDFSVRHSANRVRAEWNLFYYKMSNYIFLAPTGEIEDGFVVADYSQGKSRYRGTEVRLSGGITNNIWLHGSVDAVNAQLTSPARPLPRIPPVRGRIGLDLRFNGLSLAPELVLTNRQDRVYVNETPTAGYGLFNLKALYSITSKHVLHMIGFQLFNGTDQLYRNHLSFIKNFAPEIGRGVMFTYTMRFF
ncbi:MAG: TonB-dependent receptor [Acidobacteria bacterium]|nr:TonB-dependent receptor [Acidobacteriota bacterium]